MRHVQIPEPAAAARRRADQALGNRLRHVQRAVRLVFLRRHEHLFQPGRPHAQARERHVRLGGRPRAAFARARAGVAGRRVLVADFAEGRLQRSRGDRVGRARREGRRVEGAEGGLPLAVEYGRLDLDRHRRAAGDRSGRGPDEGEDRQRVVRADDGCLDAGSRGHGHAPGVPGADARLLHGRRGHGARGGDVPLYLVLLPQHLDAKALQVVLGPGTAVHRHEDAPARHGGLDPLLHRVRLRVQLFCHQRHPFLRTGS
mmetsp:Transcript_91338/g.279569  ORF Transcript_91338/g.279569 Transcript_91338/m.279569 type:complete len:258 (-) Transcript_91338:824-1597(-)